MKVELTKEMILAAKDYVPLEVKRAWVADCSDKCFDRLAITADGETMPPMYMVNSGLKARCLMGAFVGMYLGLDYEPDADNALLMSAEDYDKWAGSHIFNQFERMKRDPDVRDKCFDLLFDYRVLEKMFHAAVNGLLLVQNDPVIRQNELMATQMKELPKVLTQMKELQKKVSKDGDAERPV